MLPLLAARSALLDKVRFDAGTKIRIFPQFPNVRTKKAPPKRGQKCKNRNMSPIIPIGTMRKIRSPSATAPVPHKGSEFSQATKNFPKKFGCHDPRSSHSNYSQLKPNTPRFGG
jgi:hypothetical protein